MATVFAGPILKGVTKAGGAVATLSTGNGDATVCGTASKGKASPCSGNDVVHTGAGNDSSGKDDARAGGEIVIHRLSDNAAATEVYLGGSGVDTEESQNASVQALADLETVQRNLKCWAFLPGDGIAPRIPQIIGHQ